MTSTTRTTRVFGLRRDERGGSVYTLALMTVTALMLLIGLVVDGGAKVSAATEAEAVAAAAARAGVNAAAASQLAGAAPDTAAAVRAARGYLDQAGVQGTVTLLGGGNLRVTTSLTRRTTFLSMIGINQVTGTGQAEASLVATGEQPR